MKVLLIEDNLTIAKQIVEFLENFGWQIDYAQNGTLGIELASCDVFDVVLLDLNLPDIDGVEVCRQIKQSAHTVVPVLMLTARDRFEDKYTGFNVGADDYLVKPFDLRELVLRCQALAKRDRLHLAKFLTIGELSIDLSNKLAVRSGITLGLTHIGFELLLILASHHPKPVSRSVLQHKIWADNPPESDALKSHIYALRQVLDKPFSYPMLKTISNLGYRLEVKN